MIFYFFLSSYRCHALHSRLKVTRSFFWWLAHDIVSFDRCISYALTWMISFNAKICTRFWMVGAFVTKCKCLSNPLFKLYCDIFFLGDIFHFGSNALKYVWAFFFGSVQCSTVYLLWFNLWSKITRNYM